MPTSVGHDELPNLLVRVKIRKISEKGEILDYQIVQRSSNLAYNLACEALIKKFAPRDGGTLTLPPPDPQTLALMGEHGMALDLDGSLFRDK